MKIEKFKTDWDLTCEECGGPIYKGETVYFNEEWDVATCSKRCCKRGVEREIDSFQHWQRHCAKPAPVDFDCP